MSEYRNLRGQCDQCQAVVKVKSHSTEKVVKCPKCDGRITASEPPAQPEPPKKAYKYRNTFPCPNCGSPLDKGDGDLILCGECLQTVGLPSVGRGAGNTRNSVKSTDWFGLLIVVAGIALFFIAYFAGRQMSNPMAIWAMGVGGLSICIVVIGMAICVMDGIRGRSEGASIAGVFLGVVFFIPFILAEIR